MVDLVDTDQPLRQLEHVVAQTDHNELCVLRSFFDVACYDGYLCIMLALRFGHGDRG